MQGPRAPNDSELPRVLEFLDHHLRKDQNWSISQEYPTALTKSNLHNMRILTEGPEVIAHAVLKPLIVKTPHVVLKVAAIGSVVTAENHRGKGFSRQILDSCLDEARRQHCDLAVLWTGIPGFYEKMGFRLAGFEESFVIESPLEGAAPNLRFTKGNKVDPGPLLRLFQNHTVATHRTQEDLRKFLQIPQSQLYCAWNASGQVVAFAVEGKGADLQDYVHEWSGPVPELLALFNFILKEKQKGFIVISPKHSTNLRLQLLKQNVDHHSGHLGMIKLLSSQGLLGKLDAAQAALGGDVISWPKVDEASLVEIIFGPWSEGVTNNIPLPAVKSGLLPLRFWLWGWDSV